jgi:hypothetical protein
MVEDCVEARCDRCRGGDRWPVRAAPITPPTVQRWLSVRFALVMFSDELAPQHPQIGADFRYGIAISAAGRHRDSVWLGTSRIEG